MYTLNLSGTLVVVDKPIVMGIINATPDSFYAGSRQRTAGAAAHLARKMHEEGAAWVDVGGQSTRPGSVRIDADEEAGRVLPVIEAIRQEVPELHISIDTYHAAVARQAVEAGARMVNDISAGSMDHDMLPTVASLRVPYIAMHMQGRPETMQQQPQYHDIVTDLLDFFTQRIKACHDAGIHDVLIDPGFGFGKTIAHNFSLLRQMDQLLLLQKPLVLGVSRKGMIWKTLNSNADDALNGSTVLHTIGLLKGARILRVHDVKEAVETVSLVQTVLSST